MMTAMRNTAPDGSTWTKPDGRIFTWLRLPVGTDANALLPRALATDVAFVPGTSFYASNSDRTTLRLSFTTYPPPRLSRACDA